MNGKRRRFHRNTGRQYEKNVGDQYPRVQALLDRLRAAERKTEWLRERRDLLRMLTTDTSVHLTGMPRSASPDQQKILTALAEIDELEQEINIAEEAVQAMRLDTAELFCRVTIPIRRKVLLMYFFEHKNWQTIARETRYDIRDVFYHRCAGLEELEAILKAEEEKAG